MAHGPTAPQKSAPFALSGLHFDAANARLVGLGLEPFADADGSVAYSLSTVRATNCQ